MGEQSRLAREIILAPRTKALAADDTRQIDPMLDLHGSDVDEEGSDNDQFAYMNSIDSSEVSFTTRLHTLDNSVAFAEDQPSSGAPKAVLKRKRTCDADLDMASSILLENRFEIFQKEYMLDPIQ